MYTLNCKGKLLAIDRPLVMGIINATPDSFYTGHLPAGIGGMASLATKMIAEGADMLDVGGQSTRPGSERIAPEKEMERVLPLIEQIKSTHPDITISIDTYHSKVARAAVTAGASIVNDISGGEMDPEMIGMVGALNVPYVCMHMKGKPETMQKEPVYNDIIKEILDYFISKTEACKQAGIHDVIIDPGFGFGKTIAHNFTILKHLPVFKILGKPILAGLSRKSTVYKTLGISVAEALNGTSVLNTIALLHGANILRVHDVKEAKEAASLFVAYKKSSE